MALPSPPTNYAAVVDPPAYCTLSWVNGAGAVSVRHEVSTDGVNWSRLDDDQVPTTTSDHSLPYPPPSGNTMQVYLRAKSINADGESEYTPVVTVITRSYDP